MYFDMTNQTVGFIEDSNSFGVTESTNLHRLSNHNYLILSPCCYSYVNHCIAMRGYYLKVFLN
jgi:hypothetical protein